MSRRFFLLLWLSLLTGCLGSSFQVLVTGYFSDKIVTSTAAAAAMWEQAIPGLKFTVNRGQCSATSTGSQLVCLFPVVYIPSLPWENGQLTAYTGGPVIFAARDLLEADDPEHEVRLVAHEMGHVMGLPDDFVNPVLMNPWADKGSLTVTPADAAEWYKVHHQKPPQ